MRGFNSITSWYKSELEVKIKKKKRISKLPDGDGFCSLVFDEMVIFPNV